MKFKISEHFRDGSVRVINDTGEEFACIHTMSEKRYLELRASWYVKLDGKTGEHLPLDDLGAGARCAIELRELLVKLGHEVNDAIESLT